MFHKKQTKESCVVWMRQFLYGTQLEDGKSLAEVFKGYIADDPEKWYVIDRWHFTGGMAIRNHMRSNGFGEKELGVSNLDDIYIEIIEEALK